jgi:short-subunit dehydrogenase
MQGPAIRLENEINSMPSETVLITGASSGIGRELAREFAAGGSDLVLVARRAARLEALAREIESQHRVTVRVLPADLRRTSACREMYETLCAAGTVVDVVVNNAGFASLGRVVELPLERQMDMIQVNLVALTCLTRLLLPGMIERRSGGILNVASTAAFQPGPNLAVYYATKAYVLSFTEALHEELQGTGVNVTCLCPGPTATELVADAGMQKTLLFRYGVMSSVEVARRGYRGFRKGRAVVIPGFRNRLGTVLVRCVPRSVTRRAVQQLQVIPHPPPLDRSRPE